MKKSIAVVGLGLAVTFGGATVAEAAPPAAKFVVVDQHSTDGTRVGVSVDGTRVGSETDGTRVGAAHPDDTRVGAHIAAVWKG